MADALGTAAGDDDFTAQVSQSPRAASIRKESAVGRAGDNDRGVGRIDGHVDRADGGTTDLTVVHEIVERVRAAGSGRRGVGDVAATEHDRAAEGGVEGHHRDVQVVHVVRLKLASSTGEDTEAPDLRNPRHDHRAEHVGVIHEHGQIAFGRERDGDGHVVVVVPNGNLDKGQVRVAVFNLHASGVGRAATRIGHAVAGERSKAVVVDAERQARADPVFRAERAVGGRVGDVPGEVEAESVRRLGTAVSDAQVKRGGKGRNPFAWRQFAGDKGTRLVGDAAVDLEHPAVRHAAGEFHEGAAVEGCPAQVAFVEVRSHGQRVNAADGQQVGRFHLRIAVVAGQGAGGYNADHALRGGERIVDQDGQRIAHDQRHWGADNRAAVIAHFHGVDTRVRAEQIRETQRIGGRSGQAHSIAPPDIVGRAGIGRNRGRHSVTRGAMQRQGLRRRRQLGRDHRRVGEVHLLVLGGHGRTGGVMRRGAEADEDAVRVGGHDAGKADPIHTIGAGVTGEHIVHAGEAQPEVRDAGRDDVRGGRPGDRERRDERALTCFDQIPTALGSRRVAQDVQGAAVGIRRFAHDQTGLGDNVHPGAGQAVHAGMDIEITGERGQRQVP